MLTGKLSKVAAVVVAAVIGLLVFSSYQAFFYTEAKLTEVATRSKDKAISEAQCAEVKFIGMEKSPPGGVRVFNWRCLSKTNTSEDIFVLIENDGYPRRYSERLTCTPELQKSGYACE
jgi:hypothetical protein